VHPIHEKGWSASAQSERAVSTDNIRTATAASEGSGDIMSLSEETRAAVKRRQSEHGGSYRQALRVVMGEREAAAWNAKHPVGTAVVVTPYKGCAANLLVKTKTRSEAWTHVSGQVSVMVEGKAGGYGISFVKVAS
jgi:hypothetical protein